MCNSTVAGTKQQIQARGASSRRVGTEAVPTDAVFTIDELVIYLKLPKSTIYKLAQEGEIPGHKIGRHWRFHRLVIDRWLGADNKAKSRGK